MWDRIARNPIESTRLVHALIGFERQPPIPTGRQGVELLSKEVNRMIVLALEDGSKTRRDLERWTVANSRDTVATHVNVLLEAGVVAAEQGRGAARAVKLAATRSGRALAEVIHLGIAWLARHPRPEVREHSDLGWRTFAYVGRAWEQGLVDRLVRAPQGMALGDLLPDVSSDARERLLVAMQGAGLIEVSEPRSAGGQAGRRRAYITDAARLAIGPLAAIGRWEHVFGYGDGELTAIDAVVALEAALPLVRLPDGASGAVALTVDAGPRAGSGPRVGTVWATLRRGRVTEYGEGRPPKPAQAWARGGFDAWFAAVMDGRRTALQLGGERALAKAVVAQLHEKLYAYAGRRQPVRVWTG